MIPGQPLPIALATGGAVWEADLIGRLADRPEIVIVRRCVDLADLVATAGAGLARGALVADSLHRLDRDTVSRLRHDGVAVVGLVGPTDDERTSRRLDALGLARVLPATASSADLVAALTAPSSGVRALDGPSTASAPSTGSSTTPDPGLGAVPGRLLAVWGPGGGGRSTIAVNLAAELASSGTRALLADADTYAASVAQLLGLLDESPGLAAAARAANQGTLDVDGLARHARQVGPRFRVLTGLPRADRWPELRPAALERVWSLARTLAEITVIDCASSLELQEELAFDTAAPRRNAATIGALEQADLVLAVGAADPVGLQRLVRGLHEIRDVVPGADVRVVLNRTRRSVSGRDGRRGAAAVLRQHAGVEITWTVPDDGGAVDAALMSGRALTEVAPRSPARQAIRAIAGDLAPPSEARRARPRHRVGRVPVP